MQLPLEVPVMTLPSATLFPQALLPLYIFEPRYRKMLADSLKSHRMFTVAMQKPGYMREAPCIVAGLGLIRVSVDHADGTSHLILQGLARVELGQTVRYKPYRVNSIRPLQPEPIDNVRVDALLAKVHELVEQRIKLGPSPTFPPFKPVGGSKKKSAEAEMPNALPDIMQYLQNLPDPETVADLVSCALLARAEHRQTILETIEIDRRLKYLIRFLLADIRRSQKSKGKK
ncbi:MAG TPA: LON peptidase substrate-binding domain-containing protein [Candidatus Binatia bacterium]|nr:LON peptidase substrate-binding domain-containing protein [Candidatus Binatia bacterium]